MSGGVCGVSGVLRATFPQNDGIPMTDSLQVREIYLSNLDGPLPIQAVRARSLNGLFYNRLGLRYPRLVDALHDRDRKKKEMPFSLAPLFDVERGAFLGLRIGTLSAELGERVGEAWTWSERDATVELGSAILAIQDVHSPTYPRATSYEQLLADAPLAHGVWIQFDTPVRLTTSGQGSLLPAPRAVWQYYVHKWEAFAGKVALPPEFLRWVESEVHATEVNLKTRSAFVEMDSEWKGVMGVVEYQALTDGGDVPASRLPDYLRAWQALALLSEFCGTGEKATMGMGRTRRVKVFGRHRDRELSPA